jgi:Fic family protein
VQGYVKETLLSYPLAYLLHGIIARNEALEWSVFRGNSARVHLGELGTHFPPATEAGAPELNRIFAEGVSQIKTLPPFEGGLAMFLFGAYFQFFFDGNKRTSRHMMNGWLMRHGHNPISIPPRGRWNSTVKWSVSITAKMPPR